VAGWRLQGQRPAENFEDCAWATYGKAGAGRFLLNYSEKLWGRPCDQLSLNIAGKRMKGLNLKTFLKESLLGKRAKTEHLDGAFYYPDHGFGRIAEKLAESCGPDNILLDSAVTGIRHDGRRINQIQLNHADWIDTDQDVSSLPLDRFLNILDPAPPPEVLYLAGDIHYRNVVVVAVFIDKPSITRAATVYFPGSEFRFTRVYEPRNRSPLMAPPGQTSLVAEFPCQPEDQLWQTDDRELTDEFVSPMRQIGWFEPSELVGSRVFRMPAAYPVLEYGFEQKVDQIMDYLGNLENLKTSGRCGTFRYIHVHDLLKSARETVAGMS